MNISHADSKFVDSIIKLFDVEFGIYAPLMSTRDKIQNYLDMAIDYTTQGNVMFTILDYTTDVINDLPGGFVDTTLSPTCNPIFTRNNNQTKVIPKKSEMFHHHAVKLLYLSKWDRPDIQTAVSSLCTKVQNPDIYDIKKLIHTMKYL